jgi:hypothetical protein
MSTQVSTCYKLQPVARGKGIMFEVLMSVMSMGQRKPGAVELNPLFLGGTGLGVYKGVHENFLPFQAERNLADR